MVFLSKAKGDRREGQARDILEDLGYRVEKRWNRRFDSNDYFELFDLMGTIGERFVFVQVKSNGTSGALKEIKQESEDFPFESDGFDLEVWDCYDRKGWRIHRLTEDGWELVLDERDSTLKMGAEVKQKYGSD